MPIVYAPTSTARAPQVLTAIQNLLPEQDKSWRSPYAEESNSVDTIATFTPANCFFAELPSGTQRLFAVSDARIWENGGTTWTDRGAVTSSFPNAVCFCQVGSSTVYSSLTNALQYSTSAAFSTLNANVKANSMATIEGALACWNIVYNGVTIPDGLVISDIDDITNFTPASDLSSLAYQVQLTNTPGPGTAIFAYRNFLVIFKKRGMWIAQYVGGDQIWDVQFFSADVGCSSPRGGIVVEDILYFTDGNGVFSFDGATIRPIDKDIRTAFRSANFPDAYFQTQYDDVNGLVRFLPRASPSSAANVIWAYNIKTGQWGKQTTAGASYSIYCPLDASSSSMRTFIGGFSVANENCFVFSVSGSGACRFSNSTTPSATSTATTAFFGTPDASVLVDRVYLDATSITATKTVTVTAYRGPSTNTTQQSTSGAKTIGTDGFADMTCDGHYFKLDFAFGAITKWAELSVSTSKSSGAN